jgi:maltooligosyltrehalose trehalohydrolase
MNGGEMTWRLDLGATIVDSRSVFFKVWAPLADELSVRVLKDGGQEIPLKKDARGYYSGKAQNVRAGDDYFYVVNGQTRYPDPASRFQPEGVHGPSRVVRPEEFQWEEGEWKGMPLQDFIIYELHVGTFTREGTFASVIQYLDYLSDLGITALELMPVAQFPGGRNWGYDGTYPYAPQTTYGGPEGLKGLINAAHKVGIAVILDVVYNHLGPEGSYLHHLGPYYTDRYRSPWGSALNFDGPYSDEVRHFFISNALYWIAEYHIDALRLDAVHGIFDFRARHFLEELSEAVRSLAKECGRQVFLTAESDLNDVRIINPVERGGYALNAQWNDDFHHALHAVLTDENKGYYEDFGHVRDLERALREGFVYSGRYSRYRKRRHGNSSRESSADRFIVFSQSHDQVGNRAQGDRLSMTQPIEKLKLAAGTVLLSPYIPLLFMGEEYGETAPFLYFVSYSDPSLVEAVREGRKREFAAFCWTGTAPDPQAEDTFRASKLSVDLRHSDWNRSLFLFYKRLIGLRRTVPALSHPSKEHMELHCLENEKVLLMRRWLGEDEVFCVFNFGDDILSITLSAPKGMWRRVLDSSEEVWGGEGALSPESIESGSSVMPFTLAAYGFSLYRISGERP